MNLDLVELIPESVGGENEVLVVIGEWEVGEEWDGLDVRASEDRQLGEVVLFEFEVEVTKGTSGLQSPLHIAGSSASHDIVLSWEFFIQASLFEFFTSIETQVCHSCLLL